MNFFHKTGALFFASLRRDSFKLFLWMLVMIAFVSSSIGKFQVLFTGDATTRLGEQASIYALINNPAMVALFGPTAVTSAKGYTIGAVFGQTMSLLTVLLTVVFSIIFVVNRTRKAEEDGLTELFRSFQIGKLASTLALVFELLGFELLLSAAITLVLQVQGGTALSNLTDNLLYAITLGIEGFLWGIIALVFAQILPQASSAKGTSFALLGLLYIFRIFTDSHALSLSWLNPLSWSYLTDVYVKNNWLPPILAFLLALLLLGLALLLESKRDINAGYLPDLSGSGHANPYLLNSLGLIFHQQRGMIIGFTAALLILGAVYGSLFGQIDNLISNNQTMSQILSVSKGAGQGLMSKQFLGTLFLVIAILSTCLGILLMDRLATEEIKNRLDQLYATAMSRAKLFFSYVFLALFFSSLAFILSLLVIYWVQRGNHPALTFNDVVTTGLAFLPAIYLIVALTVFLLAINPRFANFSWLYTGFAFLMSLLGGLLNFPDWLKNLNVFHLITQTDVKKFPPNTIDSANVWAVLILSIIIVLFGFAFYKKRDLNQG